MKNAFLLERESTVMQAITALDIGGIGFLAFVDSKGVLLGIVTDGDIRRAFLQKKNDLDSILNKNPEFMLEGTPQREIIARVKQLHLRHMPLVDCDGFYKGVFSLDGLEFVSRENPVVIMAGGLGSRLGELTKDMPKPMLSVGSRPMLQHLVEMFSEYGFRQFIFCVNYKKDVIQEYFLDGKKFGVQIEYVEEQERLGTAGAISLIKTKINVPFFVINADVLTNINFPDLLEFHQESHSIATMCVWPYKHQIPYGVIKSGSDMKINSIDEKPEFFFDVNAGVYLLDPSVIGYIPKNKFIDMPSLFEILITQQQQASIFRVDGYWLDIGRKEDLQKANHDMRDFRKK